MMSSVATDTPNMPGETEPAFEQFLEAMRSFPAT